MPTGVQHANEILQDLACPVCDYNLRGLRGEVVACPECGASSNVARLMQSRWQMPWRRAPGFNRLAWPLASLVVAGALLIPVAFKRWVINIASGKAAPYQSLPPMETIIVCAMLLVLAGGWLFLVIRVYRREGGHSAVGMSLVAHAAYFSYLLSVVGTLLAIYFGIMMYAFMVGRLAKELCKNNSAV